MKTFINLLFSLMFTLGFCQVKYNFDFKLSYDFYYKAKDAESYQRTYFVNSQNNLAYMTKIPVEESDKLRLHLIDFRGHHIDYTVDKSKFDETKTLHIKDEFVDKYRDSYDTEKYYDFINKNDTLIDGKTYKHVVLKCNKSIKFQKRKNIVKSHYIIDDNLKTFPLFEKFLEVKVWKKDLNKFPLGIIYMSYKEELNGEIICVNKLTKIEPVKTVLKTDVNYLVSENY